jgi:prepilin-type N-terminal cleavage/methylation domain-containing protein
MTERIQRSHKGFTLVEVLISAAIFSVVLLCVYTVFIWSQQTFTSGTRRQDNQQGARLAMDQMVRQSRMAGYISENFDTDPTNDIPPTGSTMVVPRIFMASSTALAIFGNLDGSTTSSLFLYCLNGTQLLAKKGAIDSASSYTCTGTGGDVIADNVSSLAFTYYGLDASSPRNLTQIAFAGNGYLDGAVAPPFNIGAATTAITKAANALSFPANPTPPTTADNRQAVRIIRVQLTISQNSPMQTQAITMNSTIELRNNTGN